MDSAAISVPFFFAFFGGMVKSVQIPEFRAIETNKECEKYVQYWAANNFYHVVMKNKKVNKSFYL